MHLEEAFEARPTPPTAKVVVGSKRKASEIPQSGIPSITQVAPAIPPLPPAVALIPRASKKSKAKALPAPAQGSTEVQAEGSSSPTRANSPDRTPVIDILIDEKCHPVHMFERLVPHIRVAPDSGERTVNKLGEEGLHRFFEHTADYVELFNRAKQLDIDNDNLCASVEKRNLRIKVLKEQLAEAEKQRESLAKELEGEKAKLRELKSKEDQMISAPSEPVTQIFNGPSSEDAFRALLKTDPGLRMVREYGAWAFKRGKREMLETVHDFLQSQLEPDMYEEIKVLLPADVPNPGPAPYTQFPEGSSSSAPGSGGKDKAPEK